MAQRSARDDRRRSASPPISSASAISPRTSPSARSRSPASTSRRTLIARLEHMAELALGQLKDVLDAYADARRRQGAARSGSATSEIDALYTSLFRELLTYMMEDPRNITLLHASAVLRQEHRAHRRPHHQHRRDDPLPRHRRARWPTTGRRSTPPTSPSIAVTGADALADRMERDAMAARILIVEDEEPLAAAAALQSRGRGLRGRQRRARRRCRDRVCASDAPDLVAARLDAAGPLRHRALPPPARRGATPSACRSSC